MTRFQTITSIIVVASFIGALVYVCINAAMGPKDGGSPVSKATLPTGWKPFKLDTNNQFSDGFVSGHFHIKSPARSASEYTGSLEINSSAGKQLKIIIDILIANDRTTVSILPHDKFILEPNINNIKELRFGKSPDFKEFNLYDVRIKIVPAFTPGPPK